MERKEIEHTPTPPDWEMADTKPPVVQCGHLEKHREH